MDVGEHGEGDVDLFDAGGLVADGGVAERAGEVLGREGLLDTVGSVLKYSVKLNSNAFAALPHLFQQLCLFHACTSTSKLRKRHTRRGRLLALLFLLSLNIIQYFSGGKHDFLP